MSDDRIESKDFFLGALIGGVIGATAALLLAPKSGKELRGDISQQYSVLKEKQDELQQRLLGKQQEFEQELQETAEEFKTKIQGEAEELINRICEEYENSPFKEVTESATPSTSVKPSIEEK